MDTTIRALIAGALLSAGSAFALTIEANVDGPLLKPERLEQFVRERVSGAVGKLSNVEDGGKYRLFVRVTSQYSGTGSRYMCLVEIELQRQVIEQNTGFVYWPMTYSATAWGTVPSERELWQTISDLIAKKVDAWVPE